MQNTGFQLSVTVMDGDGKVSTPTYKLRDTVYADANTAALAIVAALTAVTNGEITGWSLTEVHAEDTVTLTAGIEIQKRAIITTKVAGSFPTKYANIIIPAPNQNIFIAATGPNAKVVDPNDLDVQAYVGLFTATGHAYISDGEAAADPLVAGNFVGHKGHLGSKSN